MLKIAVVGLGKMGLVHACILNLFPNVQLTAICDNSALIRRFCKRIFEKAKIVEEVEKLYEFNLDAIYITTPIPTHFDIAKTIYQGKISRSLFVEKTLAATYSEASRLLELAKGSKGANMVGYMKRFSTTFQKGRDLLRKGRIGKAVSFTGYAYSSDFVNRKESQGTSNRRGGVLEDLGSHIIDLALWYFGDLQVDAAKFDPPNQTDREDSAHIVVSGVNELEGQFDVSWIQPQYRMPEFELTIRGTRGLIKVNDDQVKLESTEGTSQTWYRHNLNDNVPFLLGAPEYYREDEYFVKSITNGNSLEPSFKTASKVEQIMDRVRERAGEDQ